MFEKIGAFFTPARRKAVYGVVAAVTAALLAFNVVTTDQLANVTDTVVRIITALTAFMAFFNTDTNTLTGMPAAEACAIAEQAEVAVEPETDVEADTEGEDDI